MMFFLRLARNESVLTGFCSSKKSDELMTYCNCPQNMDGMCDVNEVRGMCSIIPHHYGTYKS